MSEKNNNEVSAELPGTGDVSSTQKSNPKRQGKSSKEKNQEKFRQRRNQQTDASDRAARFARLKIFDEDATELNNVVSEIQITPQQIAIPLSTTTRAVGVSTVLTYENACTAWNYDAINEICTIFQLYRVNLWLTYYKLYLAQQIQVEPVPRNALLRIRLQDETREQLATINIVSSTMKVILSSIGKIEHHDKMFHMGISVPPIVDNELADYRCLAITPDNIRNTLEALSNNQHAPALRQAMIAMWSIPASRFQNGLLLNADEIYPANYSEVELAQDVHCYKALITRVQNRLPKHAFQPLVWSGRGDISGLWSTNCNLQLISTFDAPRPQAQRAVRRRRNDGNIEEFVPGEQRDVARYRYSQIITQRTNFWCSENTPHQQTVLGPASLVGEECYLYTRYEMLGCRTVVLNPYSTLQALADAKR